MKATAILPLVILPLLAACSGSASSEPDSKLPAIETKTSEKTRDIHPAVGDADVAALTAGGRGFATRLYGELRKSKQASDNIFFSPHSIHTAFGMLYAGAQGDTERSIAKTLEYTLPQSQLHAAMDKLDLDLASRATGAAANGGADGKGFRLNVTNSTWAQHGFDFLPSYLDTLAVSYGASLSLLDFAKDSSGAASTINAWVEHETEGRIKNLISDLPGDTKLVLVNAVYFNAAWSQPFYESNTQPGVFHAPDGDKNVPMLGTGGGTISARVAHTTAYDAIAIPYEGQKTELVAIAPTAGTMDSFESGFDRAAYDRIVGELKTGPVQLRMPKFTIDPKQTTSLRAMLQKLGLGEEVFSPAANFKGITSADGFYLFDAAHKAFVKLDEKGTEAAAATALVAGTTSVGPEPTSVTLDRPFIFAIRDVPTGAMLFLGRMSNPEL